MNTELYLEILNQLKQSSAIFLSSENQELVSEVEEDFREVVDVFCINEWKQNIDGEIKTVPQLLEELEEANLQNDKQRCIESIAMLRCAISDIENAFSNTVDSVEKLLVSIRDNED